MIWFGVTAVGAVRLDCSGLLGCYMLKDIDEIGRVHEVSDITYRGRFDSKWNEFTAEEQQAINFEIARILDALLVDSNSKWGAIMNTSIEGGKINPATGVPGDWSGTPWHPIWERHDQSDEQAALFFGAIWKLRIIQRPERWVGIRTSKTRPTFPNRGINLAGKTYFLEKKS